MSRILIAGFGDVGAKLAELLNDRGHEVWALRRSPVTGTPLLHGLACDLSRPIDTTAWPSSFDQVVFLPTPDRRDEGGYRRIFCNGLAHLLDALHKRSAPPSRLVHVSSTSVYGQDQAEEIDERTNTHPRGFAGRVLLESERLARDSGFATVVVRFAGIYGPGRTRLIRRVRDGGSCQQPPDHYTNRIHRDDCAGLLDHVLAMTDPEQLYIGVDHEPATQCEVMDWIAERLRCPRPPRCRQDHPGPASGKRCSSERIRSSGYVFRYPSYRDGYLDVISHD
ncbi:MAG: NAD(P)-dependent oxidoreductase [Thiotrichales bacterium]|nr:NAD(P)-dependent oxidoreductase [Thiotrichales bacterium]